MRDVVYKNVATIVAQNIIKIVGVGWLLFFNTRAQSEGQRELGNNHATLFSLISSSVLFHNVVPHGTAHISIAMNVTFLGMVIIQSAPMLTEPQSACNTWSHGVLWTDGKPIAVGHMTLGACRIGSFGLVRSLVTP